MRVRYFVNWWIGRLLSHVQRSPLFCPPGLVKFVPAVARLFCLALPGSFLKMCFAQNKGDLCRHLMCSLSLPCSRRILANLVDSCCSRFGNLINCVKQRQSLRISGSLHCPPHPHSLGSCRSRSRGRQVGLAHRIMTSPAAFYQVKITTGWSGTLRKSHYNRNRLLTKYIQHAWHCVLSLSKFHYQTQHMKHCRCRFQGDISS